MHSSWSRRLSSARPRPQSCSGVRRRVIAHHPHRPHGPVGLVRRRPGSGHQGQPRPRSWPAPGIGEHPVQAAVRRASLDADEISAHSLRAGFVTFAHLRGATDRPSPTRPGTGHWPMWPPTSESKAPGPTTRPRSSGYSRPTLTGGRARRATPPCRFPVPPWWGGRCRGLAGRVAQLSGHPRGRPVPGPPAGDPPLPGGPRPGLAALDGRDRAACTGLSRGRRGVGTGGPASHP